MLLRLILWLGQVLLQFPWLGGITERLILLIPLILLNPLDH
jgi:hypothetical protein